MSVKFEEKEFGKQGRGSEGEKFKAKQLSDDSVSAESLDSLLSDFSEIAGSDLAVMRQIVVLGSNKYLKNLASGSDEASQVAAMVVKAGLAGGKSKAEIAAAIRSGAIKF